MKAADSPRVSVIINTFNSVRLLGPTLDSLFGQTFTDWELIIWDNQSDDGTVALVRSRPDPRVRLFEAPRRMTLAEGRNGALAQARGEWLAFLDHDDLWLPHKLQAQLDLADTSPAGEELGLIYARTRSFSARGDEGEMIYRYAGRPLPEGRILRVLLEQGCIIPLVSAMVHRRAWERVGPIPGHYRFAEDYWLFAAVAEHFEVRCVQADCCLYRVHSGSATATSKELSHLEALEVLECWREHIPPRTYRRRRRVYHTLLAVELLLKRRRFGAGFAKLLAQGSVFFFFRGCCAHLIRTCIVGRRPVS